MFRNWKWTKLKIGIRPENRRFSIPVRSKIKIEVIFELLNSYEVMSRFIKIHKSSHFQWFLTKMSSRNLEEESLKFSYFSPTRKPVILMILRAYKKLKYLFF